MGGGEVASGLARGRNRGESPCRCFNSGGVRVPSRVALHMDGHCDSTGLRGRVKYGQAVPASITSNPAPGKTTHHLTAGRRLKGKDALPPVDLHASHTFRSGWYPGDRGLQRVAEPGNDFTLALRAANGQIEIIETGCGNTPTGSTQRPPNSMRSTRPITR